MATDNELKARIAELEAQLRSSKTARVSFRVGEKGGLSVYGIGRFPVTLYLSQWERLMGVIIDGSMGEFIKANQADFAVKPPAAGKTLAAVKA